MIGEGDGLDPRAYQAAFHLTSEAAAFLDAEGRVVAANPSFFQLFEEPAEAPAGFVQNFLGEDRPRVELFLRDVRRWSEATAPGCRLQGLTPYPVDLWGHQFVGQSGDRLLLVRARSAGARLEADRLHDAAVAAARACNAATDWMELAEGVAEVTRRTLPHVEASAWLRRDGDRWRVGHASGFLAPQWAADAELPTDAPWAEFARQGESLIVADVRLEFQGEVMGFALPWPRASLVLSPIFTQGKPDDLLLAISPGQSAFTLEDLRCLDAVARETASAIDRLQNHEALEQSHAKLVAALEAKERLLGRLRRLNVELEEFSLWTTHDLREPLRGVATLAELLASEAARARAADVESLARQLAASATRLKEHILALHEFQEAAQERGLRQDARLDDLVRGAASDVGVDAAWEADEVDLLVEADPDRVRRAVGDILRFASGASGSRVRSTAAPLADGMVQLSFTLGPEAQAAKPERAFRVIREGGSLALARRIAFQHGGSIRFEPGEGAPRIVLLLPRARGRPAA